MYTRVLFVLVTCVLCYVQSQAGDEGNKLTGDGVCSREVYTTEYVTRNETYDCRLFYDQYDSKCTGRKLRWRRGEKGCYVTGTCWDMVTYCDSFWVTVYDCCKGWEKNGMGGCQKSIMCQDNNGGCDQICLTDGSSHMCKCFTGYAMPDRLSCTDIDECKVDKGGCDHKCHNSEGSYYCSCNDGYRLTDHHTCTDIDECAQGNGMCEQECHNKLGWHFCTCKEGFVLEDGSMCKDQEECADPNYADGCSDNCINEYGGYHCACKTGREFVPGQEKMCRDIDPCMGNTCEHECIPAATLTTSNKPYTCVCRRGFELLDDGSSCEEVNPCAATPCLGGTCVATPDPPGFRCECPEGFKLTDSEPMACVDVDECTWNLDNCADLCINTDGGFTCSCSEGKVLSEDHKTCIGLGPGVTVDPSATPHGATERIVQAGEEETSQGVQPSALAGAIVGGLLGLIFLIVLAVLLLVFLYRRGYLKRGPKKTPPQDGAFFDNQMYGNAEHVVKASQPKVPNTDRESFNPYSDVGPPTKLNNEYDNLKEGENHYDNGPSVEADVNHYDNLAFEGKGQGGINDENIHYDNINELKNNAGEKNVEKY